MGLEPGLFLIESIWLAGISEDCILSKTIIIYDSFLFSLPSYFSIFKLTMSMVSPFKLHSFKKLFSSSLSCTLIIYWQPTNWVLISTPKNLLLINQMVLNAMNTKNIEFYFYLSILSHMKWSSCDERPFESLFPYERSK